MDMVKQVLIDPSPEHVCETQVKLLQLQSENHVSSDRHGAPSDSKAWNHPG